MGSKSAKFITTESTTTEWKQSLSEAKEIIESISAFANTKGGKILIGISKTGKTIGVQVGKDTIERLTNQISQHTDPKIHPYINVRKIEGKEIIVIEIKQSLDKLNLAFGRPYIRVGRSTMKMAKDVLVRMNLLKGNKLNNTAILLFAKEPQKFFVQAKIRVARFKGMEGNDYLDMKVLEGTILELREKALAFIAEHTKHAVFFDANQRFDKWEYPFRALEEILNNALAHRDYFSNADIHLSIYDDRIELWNPGELPKPLTPAMLKRKHLSIPRNKFLAERLFYIKYIEHWGKGTNRVVEAMRKEKLPDPVFEEISGGLNVMLAGPGKAFEKAIEDQKLHKLDLNDRQKKATGFIKQHGEISRKQYVDLAGISVRQANRDLDDLLDKKIIMPVGAGRSLRYKWRD